MVAPLAELRFLAIGAGTAIGANAILDEAAGLLELLGADVVRLPEIAGPVHAARVGEIEAAGALEVGALLGEPPFPVVRLAPDVDPAIAWAASGAAELTGDAEGPPWTAPGRLAERALGAGAVVQLLAACLGHRLDIDPLALLGERAAIAGFGRRGTSSVGGSVELVRCADGWVACNLARPEDIDALPALLDGEVAVGDWASTAAAIERRTGAQLAERAALLGLPIGVWPGEDGVEVASPFLVDGRMPRARVGAGHLVAAGAHEDDHSHARERPLVIDLSSLWAGPLATSFLAAAGARVVKVEGRRRPDGARRGPEAFFDLMNRGKETIALDFAVEDDRRLLERLLRAAHVVVDSARPRVMAALGIDPGEVVREGRGTWISITGYGRAGVDADGVENAMRVAFGDDAAVAAGCTVGTAPRFVADAVADPIAGLYAAAAGFAALVGRRGQVVDVSLRGAAAFARGAGGPRGRPIDGAVAAPRARPPDGSARALGADTEALRAEFA